MNWDPDRLEVYPCFEDTTESDKRIYTDCVHEPICRIEPVDPERMILDEIANRAMTRDDVAQTYAILLKFPDDYNWHRINDAIIERWSKYALGYIKRRAWAIVQLGVVA